MTSNDQQIDLLIRRFASGAAGPGDGVEHLDADELSAFAEGALPAAARARYVSHLGECDQCRRQASELALAAGAVARAEQTVAEKSVRPGFWATVGQLLALPAFRYAAVAAVLVLVAGVSFVALRNRPDSPPLLAKNEPAENKTSAVKPNGDTNGGLTNPSATRTDSPASSPAPAATSAPLSQPPTDLREKQAEDRPVDTAAPPAPMKEPAKAVEGEKKAESTIAQTKPGYAPAPPGETQSLGGVQSQSGGSVSLPGGPRQQVQQQMDKSGADRERDMAKDARSDDSNRKSEQPVLAARRTNDEKLKGGPSRNMDNVAANNRIADNEVRSETPKTDRGAAAEEAPQIRSAGGRKFRRQGNSWVDQKFKTSMSLKVIARSSDEFSSLDGGLRSIAQQLGGEIIVVWKGKAYLIK
ncbi:MAG TPA: hypothetical protein VHP99_09315 [Pyrinomonadaceae bacterium]|nr:hypothetical protein [Pyrinomonadaceae bacterium]